MSKASEWAGRVGELSFNKGADVFASVSLQGNLIFDDPSMIEDNGCEQWLTPKDALRFARWIRDTFGEFAQEDK